MRTEALKPIALKNKVLGGDKPLICIPLTSVGETDLMSEIDEVISLSPDMIEWRADYFEKYMDHSKVYNILRCLRAKAGEIPAIFTCRSHSEGGFRRIEDEIRAELYKNAILSGCIDVIDVELSFGRDNIEPIKALAVKTGVKLILSYHNFAETPSEEFMIDKIKEEIDSGGDIGKIAVMAKEQGDVLQLFNATHKARKEISSPVIAISMGPAGTLARLAGWMFGSDMTFASGVNASAPGQMPIGEMRKFIDALMKRL
ncbi:type I 3-dehydroquinate dehydratase [Lutispora saccharofermentans]|uniref:3-dehydroquinate dehydratase n=1 Tax=Lutispora saccharofermentans TaxID=3024236 RepID=A0ABT1NJV5_9FIRM|nr:type I 3-dehydroquinate dehydratase [Lutispora saccharofermentans]MCQ1531524.1 type I 3-dehydroquinate dehydratase [Lutispora saccharofermentans]